MKRKTELPELLSPAGDFECLVCAVRAGADAVYVGGRRFGARAFATNFDIPELRRAVCYCHLWGVKLYVTVNTLVEDLELESLLSYVGELYAIGVDALIVADLGVLSVIRKSYPELALHASTQMSVHNTDGAEVAHRLGCTRVVPARELSRENIKSIVDNSPTEIEVFLHGALCVSHSGQCLYSSLVGGRSGNRGECAQPCRLPYGDGYPLSLCDLSLAEHIPELIELGVASLKIEGRMKSSAYVYTVTSIYRRLLDERRAANAEEREMLRRAFTRGGFTDGYFIGNLGSGMLGVRSSADKEESRNLGTELAEEIKRPMKKPVSAYCRLIADEPSELKLSLRDAPEISVTVKGATVSSAESAPLTEDAVAERLSKLGDSFFSLEREDAEIITNGVFMPVSALNALRREAVEKLEKFSENPPRVEKMPSLPPKKKTEKQTVAHFMRPSELSDVAKAHPELLDLCDIRIIPLFSPDEAFQFANAVSLPAVIFDTERERVEKKLAEVREKGIKYAEVGNLGQIKLASSLGFQLIGGFRFNITNRESRATLEALGVDNILLSPELTTAKARDIGGAIITYGRIPLMLTERCFISENFGCEKCGSTALIDRRGEAFPMMREADHRNLILNSAVTYMADKSDELDRAAINCRHLLFTVETADGIADALRRHRDSLPAPSGMTVRRAGRRDAPPPKPKNEPSPTTQPRSDQGAKATDGQKKERVMGEGNTKRRSSDYAANDARRKGKPFLKDQNGERNKRNNKRNKNR